MPADKSEAPHSWHVERPIRHRVYRRGRRAVLPHQLGGGKLGHQDGYPTAEHQIAWATGRGLPIRVQPL